MFANWQLDEQPDPSAPFMAPLSHCSPFSTFMLPQTALEHSIHATPPPHTMSATKAYGNARDFIEGPLLFPSQAKELKPGGPYNMPRCLRTVISSSVADDQTRSSRRWVAGSAVAGCGSAATRRAVPSRSPVITNAARIAVRSVA